MEVFSIAKLIKREKNFRIFNVSRLKLFSMKRQSWHDILFSGGVIYDLTVAVLDFLADCLHKK